MRRITVEFLQRYGACAERVREFSKLFPRGAPVSLSSLHKADEAGLDWTWLIQFIDAECERQVAQLWAEYQRQMAPLWAEYQRQVAPLLAECERQMAQLLAEYWRQVAPLLVAALLRYRESGHPSRKGE